MSSDIPSVDISKCGLLVPKDEDISEQDFRDAGDQLRSDVDSLNNIADTFYDKPEEVKRRLRSHNVVLDYDPPGKLKLLKALGFGLKVKDKNYFMKVHSLINKKGNLTTLKTARYTPAPVDDMRPEDKPRYGEHRDISTLTILFQDHVGGLQAKDVSGKFIDVVPMQGAIVLNVGMTLEAWTGKRLKAVVHRVYPPEDLEKRSKVRKSVLYFGQADNDALMAKVEFDDGEDDCEPAEELLTAAQFRKKKFDELME